MRALELLAPARTAEVGIAAIDCGADAVYIAGPSFGARQAAGNSVQDIARLCRYAHRFGVRIYATVNTILYEEELPQARALVQELAQAGVDGLIVQDPAVLELARDTGLALHASTQCAIRTPQKAQFIESLGYGRLVLERQLSLEQIRAISAAVDAEIEFFVHGALCVCYSGQCYLSEYLTGRSANRGACAQACRSLYDLEDEEGNVLLRNKAILSLKDYNLLHRLEELAAAGVQSFKIEGRLKSESYVRNVVRAYDQALSALVARYPQQYRRSSFGCVRGGFVPDLEKTFNRGYTQLFLDGRRGQWSSMDAPTHLGEYVGEVRRLTPDGFLLKASAVALSNGDGLAFLKGGEVVGFRADVADGLSVRCKQVDSLRPGVRLYRNISAAFERQLDAGKPIRELAVSVHVQLESPVIKATAVSEDGREVCCGQEIPLWEAARQPQKTLLSIEEQMGKRWGSYIFQVAGIETRGVIPYIPAALLNGIRRQLAEKLETLPVKALPLKEQEPDAAQKAPAQVSYKDNVANSMARSLYAARGASAIEQAYELTHQPGAELMRSKYCVRHELGMCPKQGKVSGKARPLFLRNGKERLCLSFHCDTCEMTLTQSRPE